MLVRGRWQTGRVRDRDLLVLSEQPLNAETKLEQQRGTVVPAGRHYVRTHFPIPNPPGMIQINGEVRAARSATLGEIRALPARTVAVTLECAGNGAGSCSLPRPANSGDSVRSGPRS